MGAGILHTIVFHRALGLVRPKDIDLELFEITYVSGSEFLLSICYSSCMHLCLPCFWSGEGSPK